MFASLYSRFRFDSLRPADITSSSVMCYPARSLDFLLAWRASSTLFSIIILSLLIYVEVTHLISHFFLDFTNITFILLTAYFSVATFLSWNTWRKRRQMYFISVPTSDDSEESLLYGTTTNEDEMDDLQHETRPNLPTSLKVLWVVFEICFTAAIYSDIVFWLNVYNGQLNWRYFIFHGVNGILVLGELFLSSMIFVPIHVLFIYLYLAVYLLFVISLYLIYNVWVYQFLNWSGAYAFIFYPAYILISTIVFFFGYILVKLRDRQKNTKVYRNIQEEPFSF